MPDKLTPQPQHHYVIHHLPAANLNNRNTWLAYHFPTPFETMVLPPVSVSIMSAGF